MSHRHAAGRPPVGATACMPQMRIKSTHAQKKHSKHMAHKTKNILSLKAKEAMDFFMESEHYNGFEMPEYFTFDTLLKTVKKAIGDTPYEECLKDGACPDQLPDVNLDILLNKDGRHAVRPIVLANPFLYYFLVREICSEQSWATIKSTFEKFKVPHITSCALPVIPKKEEAFHNSTAILNWWNQLEQRSIELSLEYRYMFVTDITNCYGSIPPQAFDWAFSFKGTKHETASESHISKNIQRYMRALQHGRNIGIPQGNAIFDLASEIILGYSDLLLHEAIETAAISAPYEILRYRDDYRIFCNDKDALEDISYLLQHTLESLNFRMNSKKTFISESLVTDSIKRDKLAYIYNTPIFNKKGADFDSTEKHLLYILMFSRQHPDSGSVKTMLSDLDRRVENMVRPISNEEYDILKATADKLKKTNDMMTPFEKSTLRKDLEAYLAKRRLSGGSVRAMSAVCTQIALENVGCCHYALRLLSRMANSLKDEKEKWDIIDKGCQKLRKLPNSDYNQLWLQNITYQRDKKNGTSPYSMRLCRIVAGEKGVTLWNNDWLKPELASKASATSIIDKATLKKTTPVITFKEATGYDDIDL